MREFPLLVCPRQALGELPAVQQRLPLFRRLYRKLLTLLSLPSRVRTLTGKEIELDIEPDYKVLTHRDLRLLGLRKANHISYMAPYEAQLVFCLNYEILILIDLGFSHKGACRREGRHSSRPAASDLWWKADVSEHPSTGIVTPALDVRVGTLLM